MFEYPGCEWHVRGAPYVSLLEGLRVDGAAVAHQLKEAWFGQLVG